MSFPSWGDQALWFLGGIVIGMAILGPVADWFDSKEFRTWRRRTAR